MLRSQRLLPLIVIILLAAFTAGAADSFTVVLLRGNFLISSVYSYSSPSDSLILSGTGCRGRGFVS